jgi:hypothetical protein
VWLFPVEKARIWQRGSELKKREFALRKSHLFFARIIDPVFAKTSLTRTRIYRPCFREKKTQKPRFQSLKTTVFAKTGSINSGSGLWPKRNMTLESGRYRIFNFSNWHQITEYCLIWIECYHTTEFRIKTQMPSQFIGASDPSLPIVLTREKNQCCGSGSSFIFLLLN